MACKGTDQEEAMSEYISIVRKAFPQFKGVRASINYGDMQGMSISALSMPANSIVKQGTLYKQRDVFKGISISVTILCTLYDS
jgi:hypothetical protein